MATEILGFLIIVGILIVFIVRRDLWNGTPSKADEVEEASVKMRLQMEHSANAIITQMDSRIHQLEGLVTAADERARMLEQQLAAVRADQERAQQQAERAFEEMRAARASYYPPQGAMPPFGYHDAMRTGEPWAALRDEYRARAAAAGRSLSPVEGVSPVRRSEYVSRVHPDSRSVGPDFAETLSASMHAEESGNGAYRGLQPGYYGNGQPPVYEQTYPRNERYPQGAVYSREEAYDAQEYGGNYTTAPYPAGTYPEQGTETWEQYAQPRRNAPLQGNPRRRPAQSIPAEMAVEETPAVIVESNMMPRQDVYAQEEPEDEGTAFSQEQLEELARTEAEVVVSSSVADVVDLPIADDEKEEPYNDPEDEDIHAFAEMDDGDADAVSLKPAEEEPEIGDENDAAETTQAEGAQRNRDETQDLLEEESEQIPDGEEASFAALKEEFSESSEGDEAEAFDREDTILAADGAEENMSGESEEEAWAAVSTETPAGSAEMSAGAMNETMGEADYAASEMEEKASDREDAGPRSSSSAIYARELLAQGMSFTEVARKTGLGRGALELLTQMTQEKLNSQATD